MDGVREAVTVPAPVLPEECFVRQRDVLPLDRLRQAKVTVIGAGAVGSFTAMALAKMGVGTLDIYDFDTVSPENLSAQWFRVGDLGQYKVNALADQLAAFGVVVTPHPERFVAQPLDGVVVCAVDSMDARLALWSHVRKCRRVDLYLDARMGAEVGKVLAVRPLDPEDCRLYQAELYPSTEAYRAPCTARSTIYCAAGLASFLAATVGNHLAERRYRRELVVDFRQGLIV